MNDDKKILHFMVGMLKNLKVSGTRASYFNGVINVAAPVNIGFPADYGDGAFN